MEMTTVWVLFIVTFIGGAGETFTRSAPMLRGVYLSEVECQTDGQAFVAEVGTTSGPGFHSFHVPACMRTKLHGDPLGD